ncbi:hypothetical protein DRP05_01150 [Archaeoglobales archaeon]|nr:MAG: hypothetical protein DRP05_01150 [Archaeoglobales archaeon]
MIPKNVQGLVEIIIFLLAIILLLRDNASLQHSHNILLASMTLLSFTSQFVMFLLVIPAYSDVNLPLPVSILLPVIYSLEVYVIVRLALIYSSKLSCGGFALLRGKFFTSLIMGLMGGLISTALILTYSLAYNHRFFPEQPMILMALGTGFSNLVREEVLFRLGAQTILLNALKNYRYSGYFAVLGSAVLFEVWHNIKAINGLNFLISLTFVILYHRYGYEASAVAHAFGDLAVFWELPSLYL